MPLPKMAKRGIIRIKRTICPPIKLPTKISGVFLNIESIPTANSGIEVKKPKTKKDKENEETRKRWANLPTEETINPEPNQIKIKDKKYKKRLTIIVPFYQILPA